MKRALLCAQDKIAENEARAADMQAHVDTLRLSTAALQSRNNELVGLADGRLLNGSG